MINTDINKDRARHNKPNQAFDKEYNTQYKLQMLYLKQHGIEPVFTKISKDYHIPTYKYTKTSKLFKLVASFYEELQVQKQYETISKVIDAVEALNEIKNLE